MAKYTLLFVCISLLIISIHSEEYILSNTTQWNLELQPNNALISCITDIPSLCLIRSNSTLILSHNHKLYHFINDSEWDSNKILTAHKTSNKHNSERRRLRRRSRRSRRSKKRRRRSSKRRRKSKKRRKRRSKKRRRRSKKRRRCRGSRKQRRRCKKRLRQRKRRRRASRKRRARRNRRRNGRASRGARGSRGRTGRRGRRGATGKRGRSGVRLFKGLFRGIRAAFRGRRSKRHSRCGDRCHRSRCMNTRCGAMGMGMNPMMSGMGMNPMMGGMGMNPMMGGMHMGSMGMHPMQHMSGMGMNPMMSGMSGMGMHPMQHMSGMGMNSMHHMSGMGMNMNHMMNGMQPMSGTGTDTKEEKQEAPKIIIKELESDKKKSEGNDEQRRLIDDIQLNDDEGYALMEKCINTIDDKKRDATICVIYSSYHANSNSSDAIMWPIVLKVNSAEFERKSLLRDI